MKHLLCGVAMLGAVALLGGCPIYPSTSPNYRVCDASTCYDCPDPFFSGSCVLWQCGSASDCELGFSCEAGRCAAPSSGGGPSPSASGSSGSSGSGGGGYCAGTRCAPGTLCKLAGGVATCVAYGAPGDDASAPIDAGVDAITIDARAHDAAFDASSTGDADGAADAFDSALVSDSSSGADSSSAVDGSDAADGAGQASACNADVDCGKSSPKCIDGRCVALAGLCSDGTQCSGSGEACVDGVCEPRCDASSPCPTGYQCDLTRGVCNIDPSPCTGTGASTCQGGTTCVEAHCVPPCATSDAAPACPASMVCINGGCLPDQAATFSCKNDGQTGPLSNGCSAASVCLHHSCYAACTPDAGSAECGDASSQCKDVKVASGTFSVCGAPSHLGSDCDVAAGARCAAGSVCIDGYCR